MRNIFSRHLQALEDNTRARQEATKAWSAVVNHDLNADDWGTIVDALTIAAARKDEQASACPCTGLCADCEDRFADAERFDELAKRLSGGAS